MPTSGDYALVLMGAYSYTSSTAEFPVLESRGAGPCVIFTLYDPNGKRALMCHVAANTDVAKLFQIVSKRFPKFLAANYTAYLVSSQAIAAGVAVPGHPHLAELIAALADFGVGNVVYASSAQFQLDTRTGATDSSGALDGAIKVRFPTDMGEIEITASADPVRDYDSGHDLSS